MSLDLTVSELREEITQLRRMLFIAASAMLVGLMLWNLSLWSSANSWNPAKMEKIFEDMLGSRDKLPDLTRLILAYSSAAGGWLPIAMIISFTAVAWSLMSRYKENSKFMLVAVVAAFLLYAHREIISISLVMPLTQIIQGLNEKT